MLGRGVIADATSLTVTQLEMILATGATLDGTLTAIYASFVFHCNGSDRQSQTERPGAQGMDDTAVLFLELL